MTRQIGSAVAIRSAGSPRRSVLAFVVAALRRRRSRGRHRLGSQPSPSWSMFAPTRRPVGRKVSSRIPVRPGR